MTQEQYKELQRYDKQFRQATYHNYVTNLPRVSLVKIHEIYKAISGDNSPVNYGCGACQLKLLKRTGDLYFKYKKEQAEKEQTDNVPETTVEDKRLAALAKAREAKKNKQPKK